MVYRGLIVKMCTKCGVKKPLAEFHRNSGSSDGLRPDCKQCHSDAKAEHYAANREKMLARNAKYLAANRDKARDAAAKWRGENPEKSRANNSKWYAEHTEKVRAAVAKWQAENPGSVRIIKQNRRARKIEAGGKLSPNLADRLFKLQKGKCACCGLPLGKDYHLDHIMPLALGGSNTDDNIQLLRSTCNQQKHAKHPVDFMQSRGYLL